MFNSSCIELSKSALKRNLTFLQGMFGPDVMISSVVKGNAYGHGTEPFVKLAESCGIKHFSVFSATEAFHVHQSLTKKDTRIMIMGYADDEGLEWAIENGVSFYIFDLGRLEKALGYSKKIKKPALIHLELETGMNRTGLFEKELIKVIGLIKNNQDNLILAGVCTHYAGAESVANYKRVQEQMVEYNRMCKLIRYEGLTIPLCHSAASAAAITYPETRMNMVRIGIALYGFWPSKETEMQYLLSHPHEDGKNHVDPLRRVLRWSSRIMDINKIKAGEFIGYGTSYMTERDQTIAIVPVGYSDGFRRSLSNLGRVLINGKRASVIGLVNMSMIIVDVTSLPQVEVGDEVVIIGKQKKARITVGSFSDMANLVNYEMLVRLPSEIPRVITK